MPTVARGGSKKRAFERGVAGAENDEFAAHRHDLVGNLGKQIHALLPGQPADDAEDRAIALFQPEALFECPPVGGTLLQGCRAEMLGDQRVACRIPHIGVDAVDDAGKVGKPALQQAFEAHAEFWRQDFLRIGRADGGDRACGLQATLEEADIAVIFDELHREGFGRKRQLCKDFRSVLSLEGDVVDRHDGRGRSRSAKAHIDRRQRRLPVVHMDDIGLPTRHDISGGDFGRGQ